MACCPAPTKDAQATEGRFTRLKPTPAEATSSPAFCTTTSFTELSVMTGLHDGYWIMDFPFRTKVHADEGPVGPELVCSGLGYRKKATDQDEPQLFPSELRLYKNPYSDIKKQRAPQNQWEYTVIKEVNYAVSSVYGNFRPNSGLNDIILCHNYGPNMDELDESETGGMVSYLVNPGDKSKGDWEMHKIGHSPSMHRLLTGHFTQNKVLEVMGFPIIAGSGDRDSPAPVIHWKPTLENGVPAAEWTETRPFVKEFRMIHEVQAIPSTISGLDRVLIAGREGINLLWFDTTTEAWRWENIGTGLPQMRKPFENQHWGSGSVATARVHDDSVGYLACCESFHGNIVSVYVKPPGTRPDKLVTSEHWRRFVIDDFGPLEDGWTGSVHNVKCADLDGSGVDSIIVACMGSQDKNASREKTGVYVYRPIDIQRGLFARYKISDQSAGRISVADFRCSGTLDVATISYSVPDYLETPNPSIRVMLNNVKQTRHTIKAERLGDEVMIRVPRAASAEHISEMPFLDIAGKKLSIVVLPPHKQYRLSNGVVFQGHEYPKDGVKIINGELSWKKGDKTTTRSIAVDTRKAESMIPDADEHIVKAGKDGAIFIRLESSIPTSLPGLKFELMEDVATINVAPHNVSPAVRDLTFPWVACKDREWSEGRFDWPFYNLVGYHVLYDDDTLTNFCHIQAWTLGVGETAAFHNHNDKSFCEIHACISNGTGKGGMWWANDKDGSDAQLGKEPNINDREILKNLADMVVVDDMQEHGPLWRTKEDGRPSLRPNDTVDYPYHAWLAGFHEDGTKKPQAFDVWLAFEFPSTEFQSGRSKYLGCASC